MKKSSFAILSVLASLGLSSARAEWTETDVLLATSEASSSNGSYNGAGNWAGGIKPQDGYDFWVVNGLLLRTPNEGNGNGTLYSFAGRSLNLGERDGASAGTLQLKTMQNSRAEIDPLNFYRGEINVGTDKKAGYLTGTMNVYGPYEHKLYAKASSTDTTRNLRIGMKVVGSVETSLNAAAGRSKTDSYGLVSISTFTFDGDLSEYAGSLSASTAAMLYLDSETAAGKTEVERLDAFVLKDNGIIRFSPKFVSAPTRGLKLDCPASQAYLNVVTGDKGELTMPVSGTGNLIKRGLGSVTLSGGYSAAGSVTVRQGGDLLLGGEVKNVTSATAMDANCGFGLTRQSPDFPIAIKEGARLVIGFDAEAIKSYPYAPTGDAASSFVADSYWPMTLALSEAPTGGLTDLELLRLPKNVKELTLDDFDPVVMAGDMTLTTGVLFIGSDPEDDDMQIVKISSQMIITYVGTGTLKTFNGADFGSVALWSDGKGAHADADYYYNASGWVTDDGYYTTRPRTFGGQSLTIDDARVTVKTKDISFGNLTLLPGGQVYCNGFSWNGRHEVRGTWTISGTDDKTAKLTSSQGESRDGVRGCYGYNLHATLLGEGVLELGTVTTFPVTNTVQTASPDYKGTLVISASNVAGTESVGNSVQIADPLCLGGALEEFNYRALTITGTSSLLAAKSMTLDTENRGIYIETCGGFNVAEGAVLTVQEPIRVNGILSKSGPGTLALGGALSFGADGESAGTGTDNIVRLREGALKPLADDAVKNIVLETRAGSTLLLDPAVTLENGLTGSVVPAEGTALTVAIDQTSSAWKRGNAYLLPICTMPAESADLADVLAPAPIKGYVTRLVKRTVTVGETEMTRYFLDVRPQGLTITIN